jgi:methylated-DNA-[protein]-cysteine S-methyltransferase
MITASTASTAWTASTASTASSALTTSTASTAITSPAAAIRMTGTLSAGRARAIGTAAVRTACTAQKRWRSPLGLILLARTDRGLAGAWFEGQRHHPPALDAVEIAGSDALLDGAIEQLERYFAGTLKAFDVPLDLHGSPFQRAVWSALLEIAPGGTKTYGDVASAIGRPAAVRAVGAAVGRNPVSILVPCHRVIGGDGSLTGYAGGLERKLALLRLEGCRAVEPKTAAPPRPR